MDASFIYMASIFVAILFVAVAVFQVFVTLGYPLGEYTMGGFHKVLPPKLRMMSAANAVILLFMGFVLVEHSNVISVVDRLPTTIFVWIITIFLGLNTMANLISRSKKERVVMTPVSGIMFMICLLIALS